MYEGFLEKYKGDEEEATRALLDKKERQLESIMFLGSPQLLKVLKKNTRGPMDGFVTRW
jgi:hypothetical protein